MTPDAMIFREKKPAVWKVLGLIDVAGKDEFRPARHCVAVADLEEHLLEARDFAARFPGSALSPTYGRTVDR